jgi:hypothetical protein
MTIEQTHHELHYAWARSYDAARNAEAVQAMSYASGRSADLSSHHAVCIPGYLFPTNNQTSVAQSVF